MPSTSAAFAPSAAARQPVMFNSFAIVLFLLLERFLQTDHSIREVEFRRRGERIGRTLMDADLAPLAEIGDPLHRVPLPLENPAGVRAAHVTDKTTRALFVVLDRADNPPVRCDEELLRT